MIIIIIIVVLNDYTISLYYYTGGRGARRGAKGPGRAPAGTSRELFFLFQY